MQIETLFLYQFILSIGLRFSLTEFAYKVFWNAKYQFVIVLPVLCVFYWLYETLRYTDSVSIAWGYLGDGYKIQIICAMCT